ncbi:MAG: enoyl-CoA hydratase/isomerase family protein [Hymenobacteraceae bacterium]|nr:enoyl-CoA hydratase/isomerase family protein [Hymenobacteraceae bacterium]
MTTFPHTPFASELEALRFLTYEVRERVAYITLDRAEKRNALNYDVVAELKQAFEAAEIDDNCKVIVLRANGRAFSAGADLESIQAMQDYEYDENLADSTHLMQLFLQIYTLKKVVIAQIQGHAIAGGCGLATVCDFAFAVPEAKFGYTEVKIGFLPAIVSVFLLRKVGEGRTKQLLLTGDLVSADEAQRLGLINYVVSADELAAQVEAFALRLCVENSANSLEVTKDLIARVQELPLEAALRYAAQQNATARSSEDCRRGVGAFLSKEPLAW